MSKGKSLKAIFLFFTIYILTCLINPGFMGTDEYWTGITRYIPAQEKNLYNIMAEDDVKSPTQIIPLLALSHLALAIGYETPYEQYRFVQIFIGLLSTLILGFCLLFFIPQEKHFYTFLVFAFYFAGAFALTRPMYESLSAPWLLLSAFSLQRYFKLSQLKWVVVSVLAVSMAFLLRPQTGICALGLLGFLLLKKDYKAFLIASGVGFTCFILAGIPDIFLRDGFHSSLKGLLFYNIKYGATYSQQPWFFYIPLIFLMMWGPFWISQKSTYVFRNFWPEHKIFWVYIVLLVLLHSLFPQKWERFVIPVLGLMLVIISDWLLFFWKNGYQKRVLALAIINGFLWVPSTFFPAQKNIIDMSLYLNSHPEIKEVFRLNKNPQWITEVFINRKNWNWVDITSLPTNPLSCQARLVMNLKNFQTEPPQSMQVEMIFKTNLIEKIAYQLNPEKNIRRTPLVLLKDRFCSP